MVDIRKLKNNWRPLIALTKEEQEFLRKHKEYVTRLDIYGYFTDEGKWEIDSKSMIYRLSSDFMFIPEKVNLLDPEVCDLNKDGCAIIENSNDICAGVECTDCICYNAHRDKLKEYIKKLGGQTELSAKRQADKLTALILAKIKPVIQVELLEYITKTMEEKSNE